jgi:hypothetical protein
VFGGNEGVWLPAIQAKLVLDRKNPASALNALQAVSPHYATRVERKLGANPFDVGSIYGSSFLARVRKFLKNMLLSIPERSRAFPVTL